MSEVAEGPEISVIGRRSRTAGRRAIASGTELDDLALVDQADVEVGDESDRTAALVRRGRQDDRPGLGDCDGAAGDDAVHAVELVRVELGVLDAARAARTPVRWQAAGITSRRAPSDSQTAAISAASRPGRPPDVGPVLADALAEEGCPGGAVPCRPSGSRVARPTGRSSRRAPP